MNFKQKYSMNEKNIITWSIQPKCTPLVLRNCNKCGKKKEFYCSELFRMNANKQKVDVWLIYKCNQCDTTWNLTIFSRINPVDIDKSLFDKMSRNDKETAWKYAFDMETLRSNQAEAIFNIDYFAEGENIDLYKNLSKEIFINIESQYSFNLRLDKFLKEKLNVSRKMLWKMIEYGFIHTIPEVNIRKHKIKEKQIKIIMTNNALQMINSTFAFENHH
ncbi:DUF1062 domain-containing protein [Gottfriedia solisilvae]|uniref:DUF1062 domain-containing protein n=1 Tax=Gottfriedia solisilvae TaxID=1516104 RepID=A0A8J3AKZ3_9BACI|nr:DUF1062 domain-containing protein [Gottfriedia solisilvae]GGI12857.1 hypothetical protein GCM10007380_15010 [Gottfriedia solisilvae]